MKEYLSRVLVFQDGGGGKRGDHVSIHHYQSFNSAMHS